MNGFIIETVVTGWALTIFTGINTGDGIELSSKTIEREVPYLSADTCQKDNDLGRLTGEKVIDIPNGKRTFSCTLILKDVKRIARDGM